VGAAGGRQVAADSSTVVPSLGSRPAPRRLVKGSGAPEFLLVTGEQLQCVAPDRENLAYRMGLGIKGRVETALGNPAAEVCRKDPVKVAHSCLSSRW